MKERELEDYIVAHPECLELDEIIGRQIDLPHGIADIIALSYLDDEDGTPFCEVIELKARPIKPQDIEQVLRYTRDLRRVVHYHVVNRVGDLPDELGEVGAYIDVTFEYSQPHEYFHPVLVGTSAAQNVLAACEGIDISVYTYDPRDWPHPTFTLEYVADASPESLLMMDYRLDPLVGAFSDYILVASIPEPTHWTPSPKEEPYIWVH